MEVDQVLTLAEDVLFSSRIETTKSSKETDLASPDASLQRVISVQIPFKSIIQITFLENGQAQDSNIESSSTLTVIWSDKYTMVSLAGADKTQPETDLTESAQITPSQNDLFMTFEVPLTVDQVPLTDGKITEPQLMHYAFQNGVMEDYRSSGLLYLVYDLKSGGIKESLDSYLLPEE